LSATSSGQPTLVVKTRENSGKILSSYEVKMKKNAVLFAAKCCKIFSYSPLHQ